MPTFGSDRQAEIYMQALTGDPVKYPMSFESWEARARACLPPEPFDYVAGGAGGEDTMRANREAFYNWRLRPRMLRDASHRDLSTNVLGTMLPAPFLLAPVGVQGIIHPEGERASARAAAGMKIPFILSTVSSTTIEEIASLMGDAPRWFQLYPGKSRDVSESMLHRAESAGYSAIVVTVDTPILGWRERDLCHAYLPFLQAEGLANYLSDPAFLSRLAVPPAEDIRAAVTHFLAIFGNPGLVWDDFDHLRRLTSLPILLKGITHPDDARTAVRHGADGIIVSNHGGRQVDGAVATLDALPGVCEAVGDRVPVLMDSGIRRGADVLKALALGARAVLLGRPYCYALAAAGQEGVAYLIGNLMAEIDLQLALSGYATIREVDRSLITRAYDARPPGIVTQRRSSATPQ